MRTNNFLRVAALSLTLAVPLAAGFAAVPAQAQIEETIWRDQARIAAHTGPSATYDQTSQVARGPSVTASDGASALITRAPGNEPMVDGAGVPIDPQTGKELPGYFRGGF